MNGAFILHYIFAPENTRSWNKRLVGGRRKMTNGVDPRGVAKVQEALMLFITVNQYLCPSVRPWGCETDFPLYVVVEETSWFSA